MVVTDHRLTKTTFADFRFEGEVVTFNDLYFNNISNWTIIIFLVGFFDGRIRVNDVKLTSHTEYGEFELVSGSHCCKRNLESIGWRERFVDVPHDVHLCVLPSLTLPPQNWIVEQTVTIGVETALEDHRVAYVQHVHLSFAHHRQEITCIIIITTHACTHHSVIYCWHVLFSCRNSSHESCIIYTLGTAITLNGRVTATAIDFWQVRGL